MQQTLSSLLALQELDRDVFRVQQELKRLPVERDKRAEIIARKQKEIDELRARSFELKTRIKEVEDDATNQRDRIKKIEKAASGARADASLHANYEHEVRAIKREMARHEEDALGWMEKSEAFENEAKERESALAGDKEIFDQFSANVDKEMAEAQSRLDGLLERRSERVTGEIAEETLELYAKLIEARDGDAMAQLEGRVCQGCYMEVPANFYVRLIRGKEILQCPSCDRILYTL